MICRGRVLLILTLAGFLPLLSYSQNLIPNPDFESHTSCVDPLPQASLQNCDYWFNAIDPLVTVDWYSNCFSNGSSYLIPNTIYGFGYPNSGNSMVGFVPYSNVTNNGEVIGVRLQQPLLKDSAYCFDFWIKNSQVGHNNYFLREFDVAFLGDTLNIHNRSQIQNYVTVFNDDSEINWENLSSYYIAQGDEEFMLIGTFVPSPNFHMENPITAPDNKLYYFFDSFSLTPCNKDSLLSVILELPNVFTPNNSGTNDFYFIKKNNLKSLKVTVLNRWGNIVVEYDGLTEIWNGTDFTGNLVSEGIYFVKVFAESNFGDLLEKQQIVQVFR